PVAGEPGEGCRGRNPLVVEFKFRFKFPDLERFTELTLKDGLDAYGISRFDEYGHGFHRQESADASNFLCQRGFVSRRDFDQVSQQLGLMDRLLDDRPAQLNFLSLIA